MNSDPYFQQPTTLYRLYGEAELLYIGIARDPLRRWASHRGGQPWWCEVRRISLDPYPDWVSAATAEVEAIERERPKFNVAWNPVQGRPPARKDPLVVLAANGRSGATMRELVATTGLTADALAERLRECLAAKVVCREQGRWRVRRSRYAEQALGLRPSPPRREPRNSPSYDRLLAAIRADRPDTTWAHTERSRTRRAEKTRRLDALVLALRDLGPEASVRRLAERTGDVGKTWVSDTGLPLLETRGRIVRRPEGGWRVTDDGGAPVAAADR